MLNIVMIDSIIPIMIMMIAVPVSITGIVVVIVIGMFINCHCIWKCI